MEVGSELLVLNLPLPDYLVSSSRDHILAMHTMRETSMTDSPDKRRWSDPDEIITMTIRLRRMTRARVRGYAAAIGISVSELLDEFLFNEFSASAPLQEQWVEGWKSQQERLNLEKLYELEDQR